MMNTEEDPYVFLNRIANNCVAIDAQGHIVEPSQDNLEEDDVMFPEPEDFDEKSDRLYEEAVAKEINL